MLEDHPVGYEFSSDNIPLHLTHIDSFRVDMDHDTLASKLTEVLSGQRQVNTVALDVKFYGPDNDILVTELSLTAELALLHTALVQLVEQAGGTFKRPHFQKDGYKPHVTVVNNKMIAAGTTVTIKDISIAAKVSDDENADRKILETIPLVQN
jgi:hypothetical protein